jgi:hypothetical protein
MDVKMKTIIAHLQQYYGIYLLIVAVLFFIFWIPNRGTNKYAIAAQGEDAILILNTQTGQLWLRGVSRGVNVTIDLGTTYKPKIEIVKEITAVSSSNNEKTKTSAKREQDPIIRLDDVPDTNTIKVPEGFELEEVPKK